MKPATLGAVEHGFGANGCAYRRRLQVVDLYAHPDGGRIIVKVTGKSGARSLFAQGQQAWCAEHIDVARTKRARGVAVGDGQGRFTAEAHRYVHGLRR